MPRTWRSLLSSSALLAALVTMPPTIHSQSDTTKSKSGPKNPIVTARDSIKEANRSNLDYWRQRRFALEVLQSRVDHKEQTIPNAKPDTTGGPIDNLGIAKWDSTRGRVPPMNVMPNPTPDYPVLRVQYDTSLLRAYYMIARLSTDTTEVKLVQYRLSMAATDFSSKNSSLARAFLDSLRTIYHRE